LSFPALSTIQSLFASLLLLLLSFVFPISLNVLLLNLKTIDIQSMFHKLLQCLCRRSTLTPFMLLIHELESSLLRQDQ